MRENALLSKLSTGEAAFGTAIHLSDPAVVEIAGLAGFDWVSVILEHTALSLADAAAMQRAADLHGLTTLVHVSDVDDARVGPLLNNGANGVVAPHVSTRAEVERLMAAARFPPLGDRGAHASVRSASYGLGTYEEYLEHADRSIAVGVAIEDAEGVANVADIVSVPGLSVVYVGLLDLSQSLGLAGRFRDPRVTAAVRAVAETAAEHGVALGVSSYGYAVEELIELGVRMLVSPTTDHSFLLHAWRDHLVAARASAGIPA